MRALTFATYGPPSVLEVADMPEPHAGPGQIRVAVRASGVTPSDCGLRAGKFRDMMPVSLPHVLGVDAAGVVDEVGTGVTDVRPGDAVFGIGDLAEQGRFTVPIAGAFPLENAAEAHRLSETGHARGKVVLTH
ncbi:zinc-binding dehydrogenase [Streptomyces sp. NPDC050617]|uniref:alcohol dehydrogenase catalytic domain-containing protein n=1 Tax=Streptomyces sp. NPDC050617 TaxID=3154628 RepID=UPI00342E71AA